MIRARKMATVCVALGLLVSISCSAQALDLGRSAPDWSGLAGVDDKQHSLADYRDAKVIVLAFTCNHCPVAKAYEERLIKFHKEFHDQDVQLIAVNVNLMPEDRLDQMKIRAEERGFKFPYLFDETQKIGHDYDARVTPHFFVLDQKRKLAYNGSFDDAMNGEVKKTYVRDAVVALLADKSPETASTQPKGCGIRYGDSAGHGGGPRKGGRGGPRGGDRSI